MGIKSIIKHIGLSADRTISKLAVLGPAQVERVQAQRETYLSEMPGQNDAMAQEQTERLMAAGSIEIFNAYLPQIKALYLPIAAQTEYGSRFDVAHNIRYFNITRWVCDKRENNLEKLVNVYAVLSDEDCNIALVFNRTREKTNVYLAVVNTQNADNNVDVESYKTRIAQAIRGNFPGAEISSDGIGMLPILNNDKAYSVATATNIPTEKSEKFISQTIEKLLDGVVPGSAKQEYTIILLATPIRDVDERKLKLSEFYSGLAPYASWTSDYHYTENQATGASATMGVNVGASTGVQNSRSYTVTGEIGVNFNKVVHMTMSAALGLTKAISKGLNFGANFARASTVTTMVGKNEGITRTFTNYNIKHALELLEAQMKRLEQSSALGMWDFAAYVLSEDHHVANNVAHSYLALTMGESSHMSDAAINLWRGNVEDERRQAAEIAAYLRTLRHPIFALNPEVTNADAEYNEYPSVVTATTELSGKELAYSLNFPQRSVTGLPVLECAEFGRSIVTYDKILPSGTIKLGNIFHMNRVERTPVSLSQQSLASHAFVTGSTGAGKSNTIYHMLDCARNNGISFMVIEPAKGEYKHVFGNSKGVTVYGTNPKLSQLLCINPFSFPQKIHVLEHIDRLVEIFNVCWPMYAAMPAVLKQAVERAYTACGWDLLTSENRYDKHIFPSFADVCEQIRVVIDESAYDSDNKGAYKGSLLTRLQSLATGLNALIFTPDEISNEDLFDKNVIVDLSRVGSSETKALLMGMLVLKLQEYRMTDDTMNASLRHLTVLEEAHNLLRRTSMQQSADGANLAGKSVEMLANAIAEMRTYGEGFIIADQAPGLMDMSVIRNTNTKIIMRLPDQSDRELVGRAANLNDDQIAELAKLPRGVAAVYQNEWLTPVLCYIPKHGASDGLYRYDTNGKTLSDTKLSSDLLTCIMDDKLLYTGDRHDLLELKDRVLHSRLSARIKIDYLDYIQQDADDTPQLARLIYDLVNAQQAIADSRSATEIHEWIASVLKGLQPTLNGYPERQVDFGLALILQEQVRRDASYENIYCRYTELFRKGDGLF